MELKSESIIKRMDFEDVYVGLKSSFKAKITSNDVESFSRFSGDYNPMHTSDKFAQKFKFKRKIAHGLLASGFISRLVGMYFDKRVLFLEQNLKFRKPVYLNDELLIKSEVLSKSSSTKIIGLKTNILNKTDILISGLTKLKYLL